MLHLIMNEHTLILLLTLFVNFVAQSQNPKAVTICDLKSKETLIGVNLISLNEPNKGVVSDFDGNVQLRQFKGDEILLLTNIGFESVMIYGELIYQYDTIYLKQSPAEMTLGTTGILPTKTINIQLPLKYSNCNPTEETDIGSNSFNKGEDRELKVDQFISELRNFCNTACGNLVAKFQIDINGNLVKFKLQDFDFNLSLKGTNLMEEMGSHVLRNPRCFDSVKGDGNTSVNPEVHNYHILLKS